MAPTREYLLDDESAWSTTDTLIHSQSTSTAKPPAVPIKKRAEHGPARPFVREHLDLEPLHPSVSRRRSRSELGARPKLDDLEITPRPKSKVPVYTIEGNTHLPKVRQRANSSSSIGSRIFTAASDLTALSFSSASSAVSRLSDGARSLKEKTKGSLGKATAKLKRWPGVKDEQGRPASGLYSFGRGETPLLRKQMRTASPTPATVNSSKRRTSTAPSPATVKNSSIQRTPSSKVGWYGHNEPWRIANPDVSSPVASSTALPSSPPTVAVNQSSSSPVDHTNEDTFTVPRQRRRRDVRTLPRKLRRRSGIVDLQRLASDLRLASERQQELDTLQATTDYERFLAQARAADTSSGDSDRPRRYRMRQMRSETEGETTNEISGIIDHYAGEPSTVNETHISTPAPPRRRPAVLETPSILRGPRPMAVAALQQLREDRKQRQQQREVSGGTVVRYPVRLERGRLSDDDEEIYFI